MREHSSFSEGPPSFAVVSGITGTTAFFPLRLQFSYTYNREGRDLFSAEVEQVRLYLFDSRSGELKASTVARSKDLGPDNTFTWNVAPGSYHAVAWGCSEGERYRVLSSERFPQSRPVGADPL